MSVAPATTRRKTLFGAAALAAASALPRFARAAPPPDIDAMAEKAMAAFEVPGIAVTVVEGGKVVHAKGYGVRKLGAPDKVDEATTFAIGSCSKAFTSAALAILVDDGKLGWDDRVGDHLPNFRMYDAYASQQMTVRDLLTHRSGLGLGEGDLMFWPASDFTRAEVVDRLKYLKPATSFRSGYAYDNVLYIAAGELVGAVAGQPWEDFVQSRIMTPLGMQDTAPSYSRLKTADRAWGHGRLDGPIRGTGRMQALGEARVTDLVDPAGGICASARDMGRWLAVQLAMGKLANGRRLWSEAQARQMWKPVTLIGASALPQTNPNDTHFVMYALGWGLQDAHGVPVLGHTGGLQGAVCRVALIPEKDAAFAILTNAEEEGCHAALGQMLLDHYTGTPRTDRIGKARAEDVKAKAEAIEQARTSIAARPAGAHAPSLPLAQYAGKYHDAWYGDVAIAAGPQGLTIAFSRTPTLKGRLEPWAFETFKTVFEDTSIENAYVTFSLSPEGVVEEARLKAISPVADFSYDYQDLLLKKVG
jgi:CubicO group peptidase (beta-lactamase class C family)